MRKLFSCIGIMGLLGAFLTGCSMGPEQMKSVPIEDPAKVETLHEITKDAMKNYFDVDVNDGVERKLEGFESYVLVDVPTESYLANPDSLIFEGIEKGMSNKQYSGLKFKNGDDVLLVSVSLQTGKVTHFEFVEVIEPVEPAESPAK